MGKRKLSQRARKLVCEQLESRCLLSGLAGGSEFHADIVAGDPKGTPSDSPTKRVDANTTDSPFAGVGSLNITASDGNHYICTGTPIDATHVLTAGHCADIDDNGIPDVSGIVFNLNYGGNLTSQIAAAAWDVNPNFSGFASPSVNDDLTVITLSAQLPAGVPTYNLATTDMVAGSTHLYMVGYGQSGDGVKGYYVSPSFSVKRVGENMADAFYGQDDAGQAAAKEVFRFDFDGPRPNTNTWGGRTLGNDKETTLGGGDSGGPSFVLISGADPTLASSYRLAGVNTFTQGFNAPKFGSLGGGINVFAYSGWILGPHPATGGGSGGSGGGGGGGSSTSSAIDIGVLIASTAEVGSSSSIPVSESPVYVATTVVSNSPATPPSDHGSAQGDFLDNDSLTNQAQGRAAIGKRDPLDALLAQIETAEEGQSEDLGLAADAVLSRWS